MEKNWTMNTLIFSIICCSILQIALTVLAVMRYRAGVSENLTSRPDLGYPSDQFADPRGGQLPWQHSTRPVKPICVWRMKMSANFSVRAGNIDILLRI